MRSEKGFTLIELAIVLVIIGLIVGGVLVGRDLISAAAVRAQIAQIDAYQTAVNTFKGKYGYLPGDIPNPDAPNFGFLPRAVGVGDGNGVIDPALEGIIAWVDLSTARLIDGGFSTATPSGGLNVAIGFTVGPTTTPAIRDFIPTARISADQFINMYGYHSNYFCLASFRQIMLAIVGGTPGLGPTVAQAYAIDTKIDDGMPTKGNVVAWYGASSSAPPSWDGLTAGSPDASADNDPATLALAPSSSSCFDNGNSAGVIPRYSLTVNNGANAVCALSFKFQ